MITTFFVSLGVAVGLVLLYVAIPDIFSVHLPHLKCRHNLSMDFRQDQPEYVGGGYFVNDPGVMKLTVPCKVNRLALKSHVTHINGDWQWGNSGEPIRYDLNRMEEIRRLGWVPEWMWDQGFRPPHPLPPTQQEKQDISKSLDQILGNTEGV